MTPEQNAKIRRIAAAPEADGLCGEDVDDVISALVLAFATPAGELFLTRGPAEVLQ